MQTQVVNGIPLDVGPYIVLVSLFVLAALGFSVAVRWLNQYVRDKNKELAERVVHLEERVDSLERSHTSAISLIAEAIALLTPDQAGVSSKLVEACKALA